MRRCFSSYVWSKAINKEAEGGEGVYHLLELLEKGSTDCSAGPLLKLLENKEKKETLCELSVHPERVPLHFLFQT